MTMPTATIPHLLIVDDNGSSRTATRGLFEILGYQVSDCATAEDALDKLATDPSVSVCILDQKLAIGANPGQPSMDGMEALREVRRLHSKVQVIMFTAAEDRGREAIRAGAMFYYHQARLDPGFLASLVDAIVKMQKLQQDKDELKRASEAARVIQESAGKTLRALGQVIVGQVSQIFGQRTRLYMFNRETEKYEGLVSAGMHRFRFHELKLEADDDQTRQAFENRGPTILKGAALNSDPCKSVLKNDGVTEKILVPLSFQGTRIGVLVVDNKLRKGEFSQADIDILALLSSSISESLRHTIEAEERKRRIRYLEAIRRIDDVLVTAGQADAVFSAIAHEFANGLGANAAWLLYRQTKSGPLLTGGSTRKLRTEWIAGGLPGDVGVIARCLLDGRKTLVSKAQNDPEFKEFTQRVSSDDYKKYLKSVSDVVVVPVLQGRTAIGVCVLFFTDSPILTDDDNEFLDDMARRVAISLARIEDQRTIEAEAIEAAKLSDLGLLGAGVAHALRNPLAEAMSALSLVKCQVLLGKEERDKLDEAVASIQEASDLINHLRDWTRPLGATPQSLDIEGMFEELQDIMRQRLDDHAIILKLDIHPKARRAWGPPDPIKMTLVDLLANAVKAMPSGGELVVKSRGTRNGHITISIEDTGPGLPPEIEGVLFKGELQPPPGGLGLGLYLSKKVITASDGSLQYERTASGGSRFIINLPSQPKKKSHEKTVRLAGR